MLEVLPAVLTAAQSFSNNMLRMTVAEAVDGDLSNPNEDMCFVFNELVEEQVSTSSR